MKDKIVSFLVKHHKALMVAVSLALMVVTEDRWNEVYRC